MNINDIIEHAAKYNAALARDISRFAGNRRFGLVYEESKPEFVRLYNKPVVIGDMVNILPPRGVLEDMSSDTDEHENKWRVVSIKDKTAHLECLESDDEADASIDDLVAFVRFDQPIYAGLKEIDRVERGGEKPYQVVINGENFHALEALMFAFQGKVDCIYIDPPYNSGAKDWKYNNNYVSQEDIYRHSKWLTFMEDRLRLAKKLLNPDDSVLICTIDEKEYTRLGMLLEQMFPEATMQMVSSCINYTATARRNQFDRVNEFIYILMFGNSQIFPQDDSKNFKQYEEVNWRSLRRQNSKNIRDEQHPNQFFPIYIDIATNRIVKVGESIPFGVSIETVPDVEGCETVWPIRDSGKEMMWGIKRDTFLERLSKGYVKVGKHTPNKLQKYVLNFLEKGMIEGLASGDVKIVGKREDGSVIAVYDTQRKIMPKTQWTNKAHDAREYGTYLLDDTLGEKRFESSYPKSLYAVYDCLKYYVAGKPDALILDFFAGSATTAHAVHLLNAEDGGRRHVVCVTNNEVSADEAITFTDKGLRQGDADWEKYGIAHYVAWPRVRCSITGLNVDGDPIEGSYGVEVDDYIVDDESAIMSKSTGKPLNNRVVYKKGKIQLYSTLANMKMSDGFAENAVFYDLKYIEPSVVAADLAFNEIAPLLWMKAGSNGRVIKHSDTFDISENYAVLFNYSHSAAFVRELKTKPEVKMVFIVTDYDARYRSLCAEFPDKTVVQLYESYLRSFEISSEG